MRGVGVDTRRYQGIEASLVESLDDSGEGDFVSSCEAFGGADSCASACRCGSSLLEVVWKLLERNSDVDLRTLKDCVGRCIICALEGASDNPANEMNVSSTWR